MTRLVQWSAVGLSVAAICLLARGCSGIDTATPTAKQIATCRQLMGINPQLKIEPVGYYFLANLDELHRFKFTAATDDPAELFVGTQIDASKFVEDYTDRAMDRGPRSTWWQLPNENLSGAGFWPVRNLGKNWRHDIWFHKTHDGQLAVYIVMENG